MPTVTVSSDEQCRVIHPAYLFVHLHVEPVGHLVILKRVKKRRLDGSWATGRAWSIRNRCKQAHGSVPQSEATHALTHHDVLPLNLRFLLSELLALEL